MTEATPDRQSRGRRRLIGGTTIALLDIAYLLIPVSGADGPGIPPAPTGITMGDITALITAIAGLITAIAGLVAILKNNRGPRE